MLVVLPTCHPGGTATLTAHPIPLADINLQEFAERVTTLRKQRGMTQARAYRRTELLGMATRSYNRWQRGGRRPAWRCW